MNGQRCVVGWCDIDHPAAPPAHQQAITHEKTFARFEHDGAVVRVAAVLGVFTRTGATSGPSVYVFRDDKVDLELTPAVLDGLIAVLRNLAPIDLKAFAAALTTAVRFVRRCQRESQ